MSDSRSDDLLARLHTAARPRMVIALGDGVGTPGLLDDGSSSIEALCRFARERSDVTLVLGWTPGPLNAFDAGAFARIATLMPGWGARPLLGQPNTATIPTSMAAIPALLQGPLRPDLLITRMIPRAGGVQFATEVSWQQMLIDTGVAVWAVLDPAAPDASAEQTIPPERITVIGECGQPPWRLANRDPDPIHYLLAERVMALVPEGARLQYGAGQLGTALLQCATAPLSIDTGLVTDAVVELDRRGLLTETPSATYLLGSDTLYDWARGRAILRRIEYTHDLTRLSRGAPFVAVNTAIEIDTYGQVNVEGVHDNVVGGIGGHPDYCTAARLSRHGLSVIAVPTRHGGRPTMVERLTRPASTPAHDVDVIVTEHGHVDLRAAGWSQRRALIASLFDRAA